MKLLNLSFSAKRELGALDDDHRLAVARRIRLLLNDSVPDYVHSFPAGHCRYIYVGRYRVIYESTENAITVLIVGILDMTRLREVISKLNSNTPAWSRIPRR